jgi:hypothetical protein
VLVTEPAFSADSEAGIRKTSVRMVSVAAAAARGPVVRMAYQGIGMGIGGRTASACMSLIKLINLI